MRRPRVLLLALLLCVAAAGAVCAAGGAATPAAAFSVAGVPRAAPAQRRAGCPARSLAVVAATPAHSCWTGTWHMRIVYTPGCSITADLSVALVVDTAGGVMGRSRGTATYERASCGGGRMHPLANRPFSGTLRNGAFQLAVNIGPGLAQPVSIKLVSPTAASVSGHDSWGSAVRTFRIHLVAGKDCPPAQPPPAAASACVVPELRGKRLNVAVNTLRSLRCPLGRITLVASAAAKSGFVVAQRPAKGVRLAPPAKVDLLVGRGP